MVDEKFAHIGFSHFFGIGPHLFRLLIQSFHTASQAYEASENRLLPILGQALTRRFIQFRHTTNLDRLAESIKHKRIMVITQHEREFPAELQSISDPPICLYVLGDCTLLSRKQHAFFAVVGTRNPTTYGSHLAYRFSLDLAENGFIIVSGMALGIDAIAHKGALDGGGKTVAVLGCGVDIIYPPSNTGIYHRILTSGGAIISEFPPGHTVRRGLFVVRNRIISGLSQGIMVIEGTEKSGTLTTAKFAAEQGKTVFAPPAPITSHLSRAPNLLLKQGAVLVTDIEDILAEYGLKKKHKITLDVHNLSDDEKKVILALQKESATFDELVVSLNLSLSAVSTALAHLEMAGLIEQNSSLRWQLRLVG